MLSRYLLIGADVVPTISNYNFFITGNTDELLGKELKKIFNEADYRIVNLEVPLVNTKTPILKWGPNLIAPTSTINGYKALGVNLVSLANNHILDQGDRGLYSTLQVLNESNINHLGAGENSIAASKAFIFEFCGKKIGIYACVEHEFSVAEDEKAGANPFDPLWSFDHIQELKKKSDYIIILYHGGKEHYRYPSPELQKVCRRFIDKGANLVICQHSHCIGCEEKYLNGTIVYGQGNFIFDYSENECWKTGLLVKIDSNFLISYIPFVKIGNVVRIADEKKSLEIINDFRMRSEQIKSTEFVKDEYKKLIEKNILSYIYTFKEEKLFFFRLLKKIFGKRIESIYLRRIVNDKKYIKIANYIDCEAHRELISTGLKSCYLRDEK